MLITFNEAVIPGCQTMIVSAAAMLFQVEFQAALDWCAGVMKQLTNTTAPGNASENYSVG